MSHHTSKIIYSQIVDGYGTIGKKYLYLDINNSCDIATFYNHDGSLLLQYEDTLDDNIVYKMIEIVEKWKDNPNVLPWTKEDGEMIKNYQPPQGWDTIQLSKFLEWYWKNVDGKPYETNAYEIIQAYNNK